MATPAEEPRTVRLQSSDGQTFQVSVEVVKVSRTIATMLKGTSLHRYGLVKSRDLSSPRVGM